MKLFFKILFTTLLFFSIWTAIGIYHSSERPILFIDYPSQLSKDRDTLTLSYTMWACACANWLPHNEIDSTREMDDTYMEDLHIYIEAENNQVKLPENFGTSGSLITVYGSYYIDRGISRDYVKPTSQFPEYSRVFQYTEVKILH